MRPHTQNACPRSFVVPTNNELPSFCRNRGLLLFWLFTLPVLHLLFPLFQHTEFRGFVPLKTSPPIGVDGEDQ